MIDSHHHFWNFNEHDFGWITHDMSVLRADFGPSHLSAEIQKAGVEGVISVQARPSSEETDYLLDLADENDFILGVVGWLDLANAAVAQTLDDYAYRTLLKGIREICQGAADERYFTNPAFHRGLRELTSRDLAYDLLIFADQLPAAVKFVDVHPAQRFVLDHCAKPHVRRDAFPLEWATDLRQLAERKNVWCKFSGLATEFRDSDEGCDASSMRPYFETVLDAFGPTRVMFGSDWPVSLLATSYSHWVEVVEEMLSPLTASEQFSIREATARSVYRLDSGTRLADSP